MDEKEIIDETNVIANKDSNIPNEDSTNEIANVEGNIPNEIVNDENNIPIEENTNEMKNEQSGIINVKDTNEIPNEIVNEEINIPNEENIYEMKNEASEIINVEDTNEIPNKIVKEQSNIPNEENTNGMKNEASEIINVEDTKEIPNKIVKEQSNILNEENTNEMKNESIEIINVEDKNKISIEMKNDIKMKISEEIPTEIVKSDDTSSKKSKISKQIQDKIFDDKLPSDETTITTTSTRNVLITTPLESCDSPHRIKVSIIGAGKIGMACAISILMKRIASEVCLIDKDSSKAEAEAEDIRHAGVFLGNPLVTGTSDITMVRESAVVIISIGHEKPGELPNIRHNIDIFKKIIPAISKLACRAILLTVTQPIDVMSYVAWKISKLPSNRVLGTGTLVDTMRFQYYLSKRLGLANTSICCTCIGAQGDNSVPVWSSVHVGGVKLRDINPRIGETEDPENWHEITKSIHECDAKLNTMKGEKGPNCWALGVCTAEIVDAIVRNTRVILPTSTYIHSCSHGTDKDVYMSVPCVLGTEGVHHMVRQRLTDQEKSSLQACADSIRNALRDSGILRDTSLDVQAD